MLHQEAMSHVDTAWLRMDRPENLMQIVGVLLFDGQLDVARLKTVVQQHLLKHRRFRQRVHDRDGDPKWEDDPDFDIDHHIHRIALPDPAGRPELEAFVADLAATPLNPSRPLWSFEVAHTTLGGDAMIVRIHHAVGDGISLVAAIMEMCAPAGKGNEGAPVSLSEMHDDEDVHEGDWFWRMVYRPMTQMVVGSMRLSTSFWGSYMNLATNPGAVLDYAKNGTAVATELAKLAAMRNDSPTRLKGKVSTSKRVAWSEPLPLAQVKAVGKVLGASVNDVLLSCVAGAFRTWMQEKGDDVTDVEIRALVPVNLRRPEDAGTLGNKFGLVALELPIGIANPLRRVFTVGERMEALKHSCQAALTLFILGAVGMAPKFLQEQVLDMLASKATAVMTNVPGPKESLWLAGARIRQPFFWVPQSGNVGIGVSILSYADNVQFGLITDQGLVDAPSEIIARFASEFEKLLLLVLMEHPAQLKQPDSLEQKLLAEWQR
ncbi:wax ester/triacylglycerol synthase family O-acyltransferase [Burkholderiaceae bacterium DAT-1]|nr:wax ester/triacylglycerol synthase family O-acyltransferase [Burkholderiaceae bacterium DAT-1]